MLWERVHLERDREVMGCCGTIALLWAHYSTSILSFVLMISAVSTSSILVESD
jgi:hypothetical protein